ncbi:MAG: hypothetical protein IJS14_01840 [Lentisphaeria bacterium]|nr:hypothetical protein [Lentisphaeria bacterium]
MSVSILRNAGKGRFLPVCLLAVLAAPAVYAQTPASDKIEFSTPVGLQSQETVKREAVLSGSVDPLRIQGDRFMREKKYEQAYQMYSRALEVIDKNSDLSSSRQAKEERIRLESSLVRARKAWGMSIYEQAKKKYLDSMCEKDRQKAFNGFKEAQDIALSSLPPYYLGQTQGNVNKQKAMVEKDPGFNDNVQALVVDCNKMRDAYTFRDETSRDAVDPDYARRKSEVELLLRQAERYYRNQQYEKVRNMVEKVLVQDPYNQRAVDILNKTYKKLYTIGLMRAENDALEQMAEVDWMWSQPLPPQESTKDELPKESTGSKAALYEKLQQQMVDKIEYESAEVQSILENLSSTYNVQIVPPSNPADLTKKIQYLELEKMPLLDVLKYICEVAGLNLEVEDQVVKVGVQNSGDFENSSFVVRKSLIQRIQIEAEGGETTEKTDDKEKDSLKDAERFADKSLTESKDAEVKKTVNVNQEMLKNYFAPMGIKFPEGTSIAYDSSSGRLRMRNTPDMNRLMQKLLEQIDIPPPLVLVDSKVMEVAMNVLEELGFDWVLTYTDKDTSRQFQFSGLDSATFYRKSSDNYFIQGLKLLPNFGGNNQFDLTLSIRALDQKDRGEILSTPRLLVASGYSGKLTVAEERYFPDDWTDAEIEIVNGTSYTYTAPTPEFGDSTNVGTVFTVKPMVSSNNHTIKLDINTNLSRMTGWSSYDYSIVIGGMMYSPAGGGGSTTFTPKMKMPEFSRRILKSTVKIFDGETVVIGGILEDIVSRREDKWPLLGDIPLIGRLFTDSTYASEKVNLMVFVTARLMKGNGQPVSEARKQGLFEFNDR